MKDVVANLRKKWQDYLFAGIVILLLVTGFYFRFELAKNKLYWVDEAETAIDSLNTIERGGPRSDFRGNVVFNENWNNSIYHGWLPFIMSGLFFRLFGTSDFVGRIPYLISYVVSFYILYLICQKLFGKKKWFILTTLIFYALHSQFLSNEYQIRYYAFAVLFGFLQFYNYINLLENSNQKNILKFGITSILLFHIHLPFFAVIHFVMLLVLFLRNKNEFWHTSVYFFGLNVLNAVIFLLYTGKTTRLITTIWSILKLRAFIIFPAIIIAFLFFIFLNMYIKQNQTILNMLFLITAGAGFCVYFFVVPLTLMFAASLLALLFFMLVIFKKEKVNLASIILLIALMTYIITPFIAPYADYRPRASLGVVPIVFLGFVSVVSELPIIKNSGLIKKILAVALIAYIIANFINCVPGVYARGTNDALKYNEISKIPDLNQLPVFSLEGTPVFAWYSEEFSRVYNLKYLIYDVDKEAAGGWPEYNKSQLGDFIFLPRKDSYRIMRGFCGVRNECPPDFDIDEAMAKYDEFRKINNCSRVNDFDLCHYNHTYYLQ